MADPHSSELEFQEDSHTLNPIRDPAASAAGAPLLFPSALDTTQSSEPTTTALGSGLRLQNLLASGIRQCSGHLGAASSALIAYRASPSTLSLPLVTQELPALKHAQPQRILSSPESHSSSGSERNAIIVPFRPSSIETPGQQPLGASADSFVRNPLNSSVGDGPHPRDQPAGAGNVLYGVCAASSASPDLASSMRTAALGPAEKSAGPEELFSVTFALPGRSGASGESEVRDQPAGADCGPHGDCAASSASPDLASSMRAAAPGPPEKSVGPEELFSATFALQALSGASIVSELRDQPAGADCGPYGGSADEMAQYSLVPSLRAAFRSSEEKSEVSDELSASSTSLPFSSPASVGQDTRHQQAGADDGARGLAAAELVSSRSSSTTQMTVFGQGAKLARSHELSKPAQPLLEDNPPSIRTRGGGGLVAGENTGADATEGGGADGEALVQQVQAMIADIRSPDYALNNDQAAITYLLNNQFDPSLVAQIVADFTNEQDLLSVFVESKYRAYQPPLPLTAGPQTPTLPPEDSAQTCEAYVSTSGNIQMGQAGGSADVGSDETEAFSAGGLFATTALAKETAGVHTGHATGFNAYPDFLSSDVAAARERAIREALLARREAELATVRFQINEGTHSALSVGHYVEPFLMHLYNAGSPLEGVAEAIINTVKEAPHLPFRSVALRARSAHQTGRRDDPHQFDPVYCWNQAVVITKTCGSGRPSAQSLDPPPPPPLINPGMTALQPPLASGLDTHAPPTRLTLALQQEPRFKDVVNGIVGADSSAQIEAALSGFPVHTAADLLAMIIEEGTHTGLFDISLQQEYFDSLIRAPSSHMPLVTTRSSATMPPAYAMGPMPFYSGAAASHQPELRSMPPFPHSTGRPASSHFTGSGFHGAASAYDAARSGDFATHFRAPADARSRHSSSPSPSSRVRISPPKPPSPPPIDVTDPVSFELARWEPTGEKGEVPLLPWYGIQVFGAAEGNTEGTEDHSGYSYVSMPQHIAAVLAQIPRTKSALKAIVTNSDVFKAFLSCEPRSMEFAIGRGNFQEELLKQGATRYALRCVESVFPTETAREGAFIASWTATLIDLVNLLKVLDAFEPKRQRLALLVSEASRKGVQHSLANVVYLVERVMIAPDPEDALAKWDSLTWDPVDTACKLYDNVWVLASELGKDTREVRRKYITLVKIRSKFDTDTEKRTDSVAIKVCDWLNQHDKVLFDLPYESIIDKFSKQSFFNIPIDTSEKRSRRGPPTSQVSFGNLVDNDAEERIAEQVAKKMILHQGSSSSAFSGSVPPVGPPPPPIVEALNMPPMCKQAMAQLGYPNVHPSRIEVQATGRPKGVLSTPGFLYLAEILASPSCPRELKSIDYAVGPPAKQGLLCAACIKLRRKPATKEFRDAKGFEAEFGHRPFTPGKPIQDHVIMFHYEARCFELWRILFVHVFVRKNYDDVWMLRWTDEKTYLGAQASS